MLNFSIFKSFHRLAFLLLFPKNNIKETCGVCKQKRIVCTPLANFKKIMLTLVLKCGYDGDIEDCYTAFTPRQSVFFMPLWRMRAENILNISQSFIAASIESATSHCKRWLIEKAIKMQNLITYNFNQNQIRTEVVGGNPWFCLSDCCQALGIKNASTTVTLSEKGVGKTYTLTNGGKQQITIINEPNLYRLIFRSNKPQAQAFADWVYSEVLPSIRKTGQYVDHSRYDALPFDPVPYTPADFIGDKEFMKALGGMVKKCCAVAIKDAFTEIAQKEPVKVTWPQGKKLDESLTKVATAILDYGQYRETTGRIQGMLTAALDPEFNKVKQKLI